MQILTLSDHSEYNLYKVCGSVAVCLLRYSLFVQCTATITIFIFGTRVDEPRSNEYGVVRGDVANGLVRLPGPQHGLGRIPLVFAGGEYRASGRYRAGQCAQSCGTELAGSS
jgi:hypothetical protein